MRNWVITACVAVVCTLLPCSMIGAQTEDDPSRFSVTPRIWLGQFDGVEGEGERIEAFTIPLAGLTLGYSPRSLPNTQFLLTLLTGDGDGDFSYFQSPGGRAEVDRDDFEFLVRYTIPDRLFSIFFGVRFISFDQKVTIDTSLLGPPFWAPRYQAITESDVWVVEVGVGGVTDISEDSRHRLFAYLTFGAAFIDFEFDGFEGGAAGADPFARFIEEGSSTEPAFDINFGYQWNVNDYFSFSARYRGFVIFDENDEGQASFNTIIGPDIAFTFRF